MVSRSGAELTLPPVAKVVELTHEDRLLLFLPMSNFQQRMMYYAAMWYDFDIIITDYTQLYPALKLLGPTILIAPPLFYHLGSSTIASRPRARKVCAKKLIAPLRSALPLGRGLAQKACRNGLSGMSMRFSASGCGF